MPQAIPAHVAVNPDASYAEQKVAAEAAGLALWSGKGPVPAVGDAVPVGKGLEVWVEGYKVDAGWLMLIGRRSDGKRGDLAGAEIAWKLLDGAAA